MEQNKWPSAKVAPAFRAKKMKRVFLWIRIGAIGLAMPAFSACSVYAAHQACDSTGCSGDATITADVYAALSQLSTVNFANSVSVQTRDGVVYLYGRSLDKELAESLALQAPGVKRVVNSIVPEQAGSGG
jgi:hypothetical protein